MTESYNSRILPPAAVVKREVVSEAFPHSIAQVNLTVMKGVFTSYSRQQKYIPIIHRKKKTNTNVLLRAGTKLKSDNTLPISQTIILRNKFQNINLQSVIYWKNFIYWI